MGVVEQSIADRVGDRGVADMIVPALRGKLAGEDRRAVSVAILAALKRRPWGTIGYAAVPRAPRLRNYAY